MNIPKPGKTYVFTYNNRKCIAKIKKYVADPKGDYFISSDAQTFFLNRVKNLYEC